MGKIVGQRVPFKFKYIWALWVRLQMENRVRELTLFNLDIHSKLGGSNLVVLELTCPGCLSGRGIAAAWLEAADGPTLSAFAGVKVTSPDAYDVRTR